MARRRMSGWRGGKAAAGLLLLLSAPVLVAAAETAQHAPAAQPEKESAKPPAHRPNRAVPPTLEVLAAKVARHPGQPYLLNELGNLLLLNGRRQDAELRYKQAVGLDPKFAAGWNNLGVVLASMGKFYPAEEAYRKAVKIQPNYALAWYNLGTVLDARNMYTEAIEVYRRAFVLDPGLLDVKKNPQVVSNRRIAAIAAQAYMEKGNTVVYPIDSAYPISRTVNLPLSEETPPEPLRPQ
jgi:tetratricopeptide (TPR) repeat protein